MRILTLTLIFLLTVTWSGAMIETLKLPDLVRQSELICIAKVEQIVEFKKDSEQISTLKNVLSLEKALKGTWPPNESIIILTKQSKPFGEIGSFEDQVEFPPKGFRIIVFLKKTPDGNLEVVNSVQGLWPLKEDQPLGMGYGIPIKELEEVIREQKN